MPQLLYRLLNCPVWLSQPIFRTIDAQFRELLWKHGHSRIKLGTLQLSKDRSVFLVLNATLCYLASQLQHFYGWLKLIENNPELMFVIFFFSM